jgi:hypothetical protein
MTRMIFRLPKGYRSLNVQESDVYDDYVRNREESAEVYFKTKFRHAVVQVRHIKDGVCRSGFTWSLDYILFFCFVFLYFVLTLVGLL